MACVWNDLDRDGQLDADEPPLTGVPIVLRDSEGNQLDFCTTTADGCCAFHGLPPDTYTVSMSALPGFFLTTAFSEQVTLAAGQTCIVRFGSRPFYRIFLPILKH